MQLDYTKLVVIKDYESAFDAVTLMSDFQPLSIAKIKKFSSTIGFLQKIFSEKVHAILIKEVTVQTSLRDGASFRRLTSIIIGLIVSITKFSIVIGSPRAYLSRYPLDSDLSSG